MATTKMTQKDFFNATIALLKGEDTEVSIEDAVTFLEGRVEVLSRKSTNRKSKTSEADMAYRAIITDILSDGNQYTVTQVMKSNDTLSDLSNQKVSALLNKMVAEGSVDKVKDKKTTLFFAVDGSDEVEGE